MTKHLLRVNYKSGTYEEFWVSEYSVTKDGTGGIQNFNRTYAETKRPLASGLNHIESIWLLETKEDGPPPKKSFWRKLEYLLGIGV